MIGARRIKLIVYGVLAVFKAALKKSFKRPHLIQICRVGSFTNIHPEYHVDPSEESNHDTGRYPETGSILIPDGSGSKRNPEPHTI